MSAARRFKPALRCATLLGAGGSSIWAISTRRTRVLHDGGVNPQWTSDTALHNRSIRIQKQFASTQTTKESDNKAEAESIDRATDVDTYSPVFEDDDDNAWKQFSRNLDYVLEGVKRVQWSGIGDKLTDWVLPQWAKYIPDAIQKLNFELTMQQGTLADEIWQEAHDAEINPEILWNARVRVGDSLGKDELRFRQKRKEQMVPHFKKYLGLTEDVDPEDIPTIAMCGSGGGLRALVAGTSSYLSAYESGLFDCCTYTAGVSGSCWLQTLFFSSVGKQNHAAMLNHIKSRIGTHIAFPPPALKMVTSAPTNKFILSGFVEKLKGDPTATFGLVDIYSLLLAARLMVPRGELDVQDSDLKLSNQREFLKSGEYPMPIYTVVRHEIPVEEEAKDQNPVTPAQAEATKIKAKKEAWFQWIELHPWEVWCEEFGAGIPTWSLGRPFDKGQNRLLDTGIALPEMRQSLLLGIYGSAFCATLSHYYKEVKPVLAGFKGFGSLDELMEGKNEDLVKIHPIEPATIPNFVYGMKDALPGTCPESVFRSDHLQVMDAGMSNNLPIYPLLRPGRDVDVMIAFDASADIQRENWLSVVDGYAKQRGVKSWPVGTGWPKQSSKPEENLAAYETAQASTPAQATQKLAEAKEVVKEHARAKQAEAVKGNSADAHVRSGAQGDLGYCNIWVGTKEERQTTEEPPPSKRISWEDEKDSTFHLMEPNATMTVIYYPLLPNDKVPGVNPDETDYLSTWNFIYTPEQVDKVIELARTNFKEGEDATRRTIRAVYERKKAARLKLEDEKRAKWWSKTMKKTGDTFTGS